MSWLKRLALRFVLGRSLYGDLLSSLREDKRLPRAHAVDILVRKDGVERRLEADWLKDLSKILKI